LTIEEQGQHEATGSGAEKQAHQNQKKSWWSKKPGCSHIWHTW
jgi:hypothetical protein